MYKVQSRAFEPSAEVASSFQQSSARVMVVRWTPIDRSEHVRCVLEFLKSKGFDIVFVSVVEPNSQEDAPPQGFGVRNLGLTFDQRGLAKLFAFPKLVIKLWNLFRTLKPDILYGIDSWTLPLLYVATLGRFCSRRWRFVYHTFDWLEPGQQAWWNVAAERRACRAADLVVNVDRSRARLQRTCYRLTVTPLELPNFRNLRYLTPGRNQFLLKNIFADYTEDMVVLVCPTVAAAPRLTVQLIEALALLPPRYRLVTFAVASEYRQLCLQRVEALGLETRIRFLAPRSHREWLAVVASGDIGVIFHDVDESSGYFMANSDRLASFIACGIPVICMNVPNLEALVYRFGLGICCDPKDARSVARAARSLAEDFPGLDVRRSQIRKVFEEDLHFENFGQRLVDKLSDFRRGVGL